MNQEIKEKTEQEQEITAREIKTPKYRIVPDTTSNDVQQFDIVWEFNGAIPIAYMHEDLQHAIDTLVTNHGTIYLKLNWFSDDLQLFIPGAPKEADLTVNPEQGAKNNTAAE